MEFSKIMTQEHLKHNSFEHDQIILTMSGFHFIVKCEHSSAFSLLLCCKSRPVTSIHLYK